MTVLVEGRGLQKRYAGVDALVDVDVDVPAGTLVALTGPSGSGKSTLLHCLAGLTRPDAGTVTVDGVPLPRGERGLAALRRARFAVVLQRRNLLPALTVRENIALPLLMRHVPAVEVEERTREALALMGLDGRAGAWPAELSGGEAQRVALARAVAARPAVLWADEPTGALDSAAAAVLVALLRAAVSQRGLAVLLVTHDPALAAVADVEVRLRDGRRVA